MYTPSELLADIDRGYALLVGLAVAMVFQTAWLVEAIRVAHRDRAYSIPLACTYLWFAHDIGFVLRYHQWAAYHHWFLNLFWLGLLSAAVLELVFFAQVVRFGHDETAPGLTHGQFAGVVATGALGAILAWEYLRLVFDDPLYLGASALTLVSYALFGPALFLRRRGGLGQSRLMWLCFTAMSATWWATTALFLTPAFRSWQYLGAGVFCVVVGGVMVKVLSADRISKRTPVRSDLTTASPRVVGR
jgi:hypothetical protein